MASFGVIKSNDDGGATPRFYTGTVVSEVRVFRSDSFFSEFHLIGQPANFSSGMAQVTPTVTQNSVNPSNNIQGLEFTPGAVLGWNMTLETFSANIDLSFISADQGAGIVNQEVTVRVYNDADNSAPLLYNGNAEGLISAGPVTGQQVYVEIANTTPAAMWLFQWTADEIPALATVSLSDPVPLTPAMTRTWEVIASGDPAIPVGTTGTGGVFLTTTFDLSGELRVRVTDTVTEAGIHQNTANINATDGGPFTSTTAAITFVDPDVETDCDNEHNEVHSNQISMVGNALGLPPGDFVRFVVSTSPTGPFTPGDPSVVFLGSNRLIVTGANPETFRHTVPHQDLFLDPDTDYYWVVQHIASDAVTIISQSADICAVHTRDADDQNYITCSTTGSAQTPQGRTALFSGTQVPAGNEDFPAQLANDQMLVEVGPTATGPWTTAVRYNGLGGSTATNTPGANPTGGINPLGGLLAAIGDLTHNTQYFTRHTLLNTAAPTLNPIQRVVCGPATTFDRPNPTCGLFVNQITQRSARVVVSATTATENGGTGRFVAGDVITIEAGTSIAGPFTPAGSFTVIGAPSQFSQNQLVTVPLTGLQPNTEYFYRIRCTEVVESGGQYWLSPPCGTSFRTLPVPVDLDCDAAGNVIGVSGLTMTAVSNNAPAGTSLRFRLGTTAGGPYTTFVGPIIPTTPGLNQQYTQVINPGTLQPDTQYYWRVEWIDTDSTAFLGTTECAVRTLPLPNCDTITVTEVTSINAKVSITPPDWLPGDTVRVLTSTSPMGPFNAALVHDVAAVNEPITLDFLNLLQPARTYYFQVEIDHQPETGIPDYFAPICQFTTAGGGSNEGPWREGDPRCMNECKPAGNTPVTIASSGCGCP